MASSHLQDQQQRADGHDWDRIHEEDVDAWRCMSDLKKQTRNSKNRKFHEVYLFNVPKKVYRRYLLLKAL